MLLVGGATLMPSVQRRLHRGVRLVVPTGRPASGRGQGRRDLRRGAARRGDRRGRPGMPKVRKVLPRSFGVRLDRETSLDREHLYIEYIANANDPLPIAQRRLVAYTKIDNVETQSFHFFEQNGDSPSPVIALNREVTPPDGFVFRGLPKLSQGFSDHHRGQRRRGRPGHRRGVRETPPVSGWRRTCSSACCRSSSCRNWRRRWTRST